MFFYFFEREGGNNKVVGRDIRSWSCLTLACAGVRLTGRNLVLPTRFGNWHEQSAQGTEGHLGN